MTEFQIIVLVVLLFSVVQSIFGIGLLVFGTPTFLLLDYPFEVTLSYLLPASISISCMQILHGRDQIKLKKDFLIYTVPFIMIGLSLVLANWFSVDINILVGLMLVLTGAIRLQPKIQNWMGHFLKKHMKLYLVAMGLLHGLSNMGGCFLTILSPSVFKSKEEIRANIAYGYLVFALTQIFVLAILNPGLFHLGILVFPCVSVLAYIFLGNVIFLKSKESVYQMLITTFVLVYGVVMLIPFR